MEKLTEPEILPFRSVNQNEPARNFWSEFNQKKADDNDDDDDDGGDDDDDDDDDKVGGGSGVSYNNLRNSHNIIQVINSRWMRRARHLALVVTCKIMVS
jgi:hypothetical protein